MDLLAEVDGRLLRVQVKTSTYAVKTSRGLDRWNVGLTTSGGNQTWTGAYKALDPARSEEHGWPLVYREGDLNRIGSPLLGECQSGQMEQTVNLPAMPTEVRILPPPSNKPGSTAQVLFRSKRQATIPRRPCEEAGLEAGDRLRVRADGPGRVLLEKIVSPS